MNSAGKVTFIGTKAGGDGVYVGDERFCFSPGVDVAQLSEELGLLRDQVTLFKFSIAFKVEVSRAS